MKLPIIPFGAPADPGRRRFVAGLAAGGAIAGSGLWRNAFAAPMAQAPRVLSGTDFALDIGATQVNFPGKLRPAVPVPKDKGRAVFEQIERRGAAPALLERTAGNQFKLRIYPIPAQGTRRVRLELREALRRDGGRWRFELPLAFAADAGRFDLQLRSAEQPRAEGLSGDARIDKAKGGYRLSLARAPAGGALALSVPASAISSPKCRCPAPARRVRCRRWSACCGTARRPDASATTPASWPCSTAISAAPATSR